MKQSWAIAKGTATETVIAVRLVCDNGLVIPEVSFEEIYAKYYKEVLNFLKFKMGNGHYEIAEEICDDTFMKAKKHLATYDKEMSKINTWLKGIAYHQMVDHYRKATKVVEVEVENEYGVSSTKKVRKNINTNISDYVDADGDEYFQINAESNTSASVESKEVLSDVAKAFRTLKPKFRKIAIAHFLRQKSYEEVAEICQMPLNSVKVNILRLRATLQSELQKYREDYALD
jgi:RNA polymerase sigma-70 factor (ECF subfamily)